MLALLDVPVDDAAWQALDPAQRRQRTLDAVRRFLLREAREQPYVNGFTLGAAAGQTWGRLRYLLDGELVSQGQVL